MDDFETFKASREKMDPSTHKFSDTQWQSAYAAYCSSRKRLSGSGRSESSDSSKRRRKSSKENNVSRSASRVTHSPIVSLRNEVRQSSAYSDLRMMIDLLAWIAIGVAVVAAAVKLAYYTNGAAALASIMDSVFLVIAVVVLRLLAHVIIDIPDIALHHRRNEDTKSHSGQGTG